MPGEESVKRFERSNGLDTALYKTIPFFLPWNAYDLHDGSRVQSGAHCRFANGLRPVARAHHGEPGMVFPFLETTLSLDALPGASALATSCL